jgi:hypothetical protein
MHPFVTTTNSTNPTATGPEGTHIMRKLATLALLALSLLTVACTETEDADFETAPIDEVAGLEMGDEVEGFSERAPAALQAKVDRVSDASRPVRPPSAPSGEPIADRVGANERNTAAGEPGTGTAECFTQSKLQNGEPVVGAATTNAGQLARARYEQISRIKGIR